MSREFKFNEKEFKKDMYELCKLVKDASSRVANKHGLPFLFGMTELIQILNKVTQDTVKMVAVLDEMRRNSKSKEDDDQ